MYTLPPVTRGFFGRSLWEGTKGMKTEKVKLTPNPEKSWCFVQRFTKKMFTCAPGPWSLTLKYLYRTIDTTLKIKSSGNFFFFTKHLTLHDVFTPLNWGKRDFCMFLTYFVFSLILHQHEELLLLWTFSKYPRSDSLNKDIEQSSMK